MSGSDTPGVSVIAKEPLVLVSRHQVEVLLSDAGHESERVILPGSSLDQCHVGHWLQLSAKLYMMI